MIVSAMVQPQRQLGSEISAILEADHFERIVFVSAFVGLKAILRLRERLLEHMENGTDVCVVVGIDLGGTSKEVLEELSRWGCRVYVFHNAIPRSTFHPKIYLFESNDSSTVFIGSNNLTDGGLYSNYEAAAEYKFLFPDDRGDYEEFLLPLSPFLLPEGEEVCELSPELINTLVERDQVPSEEEVRRRNQLRQREGRQGDDIPDNPFPSLPTPRAPLLKKKLRDEDLQTGGAPFAAPELQAVTNNPRRVLVWRKVLPASDALQVREGTAHVGGVRLTQARFESPPGTRIDQTTYFRQLFDEYVWEPETGRRRGADQEHTFVPMRIVIRGEDHGVHNFEISHKPDGEAGQDNYTTILRWGRELNKFIQEQNLTGATLFLYEVVGDAADFLIDIVEE